MHTPVAGQTAGSYVTQTRPTVTIVGGLYPHNFQPVVRFLSSEFVPRVLMSRQVYEKIGAYIDLSEIEIGWLGTIQRKGRDFIIDDVFLFKQRANTVMTQITEQGLGEFVVALLEELDEEIALDITQRLHFWGHSHVHADTGPSKQDEDQTDIFLNSGIPWFVRGIFNKKGKASFDIFLIEEGLQITDAPWEIIEEHNAELRNQIALEIAYKVKYTPSTPKVYQQVKGGGEGYPYTPTNIPGQAVPPVSPMEQSGMVVTVENFIVPPTATSDETEMGNE
jgi:hypothetical protein